MNVNYSIIPAKAGIQETKQDAGFPIRSGMTSVWKTSPLHIGLLCGIFANGIPAARADVTIENPLGENTNSIPALINSIIDQLMPVAVTIAIFAIIVVGFQFVMAAVQGEPGKIKDARRNLMWVLIGVAIVVGAKALAAAAQSFFETINKTP